MKKLALTLMVLVLGIFLASGATAAPVIELFDWGFNVNGTKYFPNDGDVLPAGFNTAGFDVTTGLGAINISYKPGVAGSYYLLSFFDHDINVSVNTYFDETGSKGGAGALAGQTWEVGDPELGTVYTNFTAGTLANNSGPVGPTDIAMAMGWNFVLTADQTAYITFALGTTEPNAFYLKQTDPGFQGGPNEESADPGAVYLSSSLAIRGGGTQVPEPATLFLLGAGIFGLAGLKRRFNS